MTIKFNRIADARAYLTANGYLFASRGLIDPNHEIYENGPLTACLSRKPFQGVQVRIR